MRGRLNSAMSTVRCTRPVLPSSRMYLPSYLRGRYSGGHGEGHKKEAVRDRVRETVRDRVRETVRDTVRETVRGDTMRETV